MHTRQLIAEAAARLFVQRGFDAVTVDEVAEAADVARKTVFNYFPTEIATATGAPDHDSVAFTAACSLLGAYRSLAREYGRRHAAGQAPDVILLALHAEGSRVFDLLDHGMAPGPVAGPGHRAGP
ncbi:MAG: TetR family transcriptional regulator [Pseudonocardiaceae bacterium]